MASVVAGLTVFVVAYLLGSIPTGYVAGALLKGIDIREHGSRSSGATNVLRTLGAWPALVVLAVDVLKGVAAVAFAMWAFPSMAAGGGATFAEAEANGAAVAVAVAVAGIGALLGHARSIWLGFTGGKSAATGLGVLAGLSWPIALGAAGVFALTLLATRIVSASSMLAALAAVALVLAFDEPLPYRLLVIAGGLYVILRHRANIERLLAGVEPRLWQGGPKTND